MGSWYNENSGSKNYLVYFEEDQTVKFDTVLIGMIANNKIDGIISFVFSQQNTSSYVKFDTTSKISLAQFLEKTISKQRFLTLVSSICSAINGLRNYMIDQNAVILTPDMIYVDISKAQAYLIVNPVVGNYEKTNYQKFFRNMLVNTSFDITEDNNYVAKILSYINAQNNFSLVEFNRFIQDMMSNNADNIVQETVPENVANMDSFNPLPQSVPVNSEPINNANAINIPSNSGGLPVNSGNMLPNNPNVLPTPSPETETKGKKSGFMGKLFGGEKDKKKGKKSSKKSAGNASSMTGINIPGQSPVANNIPAGEDNSNNMANAAQPVAQMSNIPQMTIPASSSVQNTMYGASTANNGVMGVTMGGMPSNTNFNSGNVIPQPVVQPNDNDNESDYTTLLVDDDFGNGVAMLRRVRTNESISINKDKFVIGKEKNFVDYYVDGNATISRSHAYILKRQESYFIVDTNSKNHTYLNGRIISSNVEEPLNNGDKIKLANEEFIFIQ